MNKPNKNNKEQWRRQLSKIGGRRIFFGEAKVKRNYSSADFVIILALECLILEGVSRISGGSAEFKGDQQNFREVNRISEGGSRI